MMKKLSVQRGSVPLMASFILISSFAYSQESIVLPPMPTKDDSSMLGPDVNKNGVRDDLEHYIYNEITKDPAWFKAHLNYAQSYQAQLDNLNDKSLIKKYSMQLDGDLKCIFGLNPDSSGTSLKLIKKLLNNEKRKNAALEVQRIENELDIIIKGLSRKEKIKLCRN